MLVPPTEPGGDAATGWELGTTDSRGGEAGWGFNHVLRCDAQATSSTLCEMADLC